MDKQTLIRDMERRVNNAGFMNLSQITKYMRHAHSASPRLVKGLDCITTGREKKYFIPDVAQRIMDSRTVSADKKTE